MHHELGHLLAAEPVAVEDTREDAVLVATKGAHDATAVLVGARAGAAALILFAAAGEQAKDVIGQRGDELVGRLGGVWRGEVARDGGALCQGEVDELL